MCGFIECFSILWTYRRSGVADESNDSLNNRRRIKNCQLLCRNIVRQLRIWYCFVHYRMPILWFIIINIVRILHLFCYWFMVAILLIRIFVRILLMVFQKKLFFSVLKTGECWNMDFYVSGLELELSGERLPIVGEAVGKKDFTRHTEFSWTAVERIYGRVSIKSEIIRGQIFFGRFFCFTHNIQYVYYDTYLIVFFFSRRTRTVVRGRSDFD